MSQVFDPSQPPADPFSLFGDWFEEAVAQESVDPNAMTVATVDANGRPSARILLMKHVDSDGFVFYSNLESRKGSALAANPVAALCFHWKSLSRQVRVEGPVSPVTDAEADEYFASRPRGSRIGAWASQQSRPLDHRDTLIARTKEIESRFPDETVDRPPHWSGYRLAPDYIEFWMNGEFRLHDRLVYTRPNPDEPWSTTILYP